MSGLPATHLPRAPARLSCSQRVMPFSSHQSLSLLCLALMILSLFPFSVWSVSLHLLSSPLTPIPFYPSSVTVSVPFPFSFPPHSPPPPPTPYTLAPAPDQLPFVLVPLQLPGNRLPHQPRRNHSNGQPGDAAIHLAFVLCISATAGHARGCSNYRYSGRMPLSKAHSPPSRLWEQKLLGLPHKVSLCLLRVLPAVLKDSRTYKLLLQSPHARQ